MFDFPDTTFNDNSFADSNSFATANETTQNTQVPIEPSLLTAYAMEQASLKSQRDWSEKMSNTAYQRAVEDMKKAGLNPYAMYSGVGGASSTPTTSASGSIVASNMLTAQMNNNTALEVARMNNKTQETNAYIKGITSILGEVIKKI